MTRLAPLILLLALAVPTLSRAVSVTPKEKADATQWFESQFAQSTAPFSFIYDEKSSAALLKTWKCEKDTKKLDDDRTQHTLTYTDPKTGLEVRCVAVKYNDFPTVEWTLYFKNTGKADTPILKNIQALDLHLSRGEKGEFLLHHSPGATSQATDYAPRQTVLAVDKSLRFAPRGGRPADGAWPYYNIEFDGGGMIVVVGWPGQWASHFNRDAERGLHILAGQELINLKLHPGEEIRSPRIVIQHYRGDWIRSQNIWRRWMMAHNMPRPGGKLPQPKLLSFSGRLYCEMCLANEANQLMCIDRYLEEGIKLDYWWMDAGWYKQGGGQGNWPKVGTWEVDTERFPRGLRAVSDHAHSKEMKTVLWFEPERVHPGTWLAKERPQWLLGGILLNLGNPAARQWLTDHVDRILTEQAIDLYRQDFNTTPLAHWRSNDAPDRQGITENKHVVGYLKFWDDLAARHPNMLIDSCASGGRRNELEAMRRAVPLWRSDHAYRVVANQCMSYGISLWIPYHGTGVTACATTAYHGTGQTPIEPYAFWSTATPAICLALDIREKGIDYPALVNLIKQWREAGQYYNDDYYPLLPYTHDKTAWIAWQFHDADKNEGMVEAFRRSGSETDSMLLKLHDLKPECLYTVTYLDSKQSQEATGQKLMSDGLSVKIPAKPGVAVLLYKPTANEKKLTKLPEVLGKHVMETTPIVFNGRRLLFHSHRPAGHAVDLPNTYLGLMDMKTGEQVARFGQEHSFGSAYVQTDPVKGDTVHAFAAKYTKDDWSQDINHFWSKDLKTWQQGPAIKRRPGEHLFNSSVCRDGDGYLMAYESNKPVGFCFKFARSHDLMSWKPVEGLTFTGKDGEYSACPVIRYCAPYYYVIYLHSAIPGHNGHVSFLARSKDLKTWQLSPKNPILEACQGEGTNNSDVDLIELDGKTYLYYATGDQSTWLELKRAVYPAPMKEFFESYFPAGAKADEVSTQKSPDR